MFKIPPDYRHCAIKCHAELVISVQQARMYHEEAEADYRNMRARMARPVQLEFDFAEAEVKC